nr:MAG TPA: hypothetical protein [Herelleviridae sp.]
MWSIYLYNTKKLFIKIFVVFLCEFKITSYLCSVPREE